MKKFLFIVPFLFSTVFAHEIYLFSSPSCPYCIKVMKYLDKEHKTIHVKNIRQDKKAHEELVAKGGKSQIPCLFYDGTYLYESSDIIQWLSEHLDLLPDAT